MAAAAEGSFKPKFRREVEWIPKTDLGRLVKMGKITSIDEIFRSVLPIREPEIVDHLLGKANLREELIAVKSVQKQSKAGQKTSMKVCAVVGNCAGYIGIGTHSSRELSSAIKGAVSKAKLAIKPIRMGQWDGDNGDCHTIATKASGKSGSVTVNLIPAPMGTGIEVSDIHRRIFELAGIQDIFVKSFGNSNTKENLAKATIAACYKASEMFIPSQWDAGVKTVNPLVKHSDLLAQLKEITLN